MRILELICSPLAGGAENHTRLISKALAGKGCEVRLAAVPGEYAGRFMELREHGISVTVNKLFDYTGDMLSMLKDLLRAGKTDIIHCHMHRADMVGSMIRGYNRRIKLVTTVHNMMWLDLRGSIKRYLYYFPVRHALNSMDRVFTVSDYVREHVRKYYGLEDSAVKTILNSVDLGELQPDAAEVKAARAGLGIEEGKKTVLCVGRLEYLKGQRLLLKSFKKVLSGGVNARLVLLGSGPDEGLLKSSARELGLEGKVHFAGYRNNVADYLGFCDVLVHPSMHDSLSRTVLEAMAMEVPVITTDSGGASEVISDGDNGILIKPGDGDALAGRISDLLDDREKRIRLGKKAAEFVRNNASMDVMADRYISEFSGLLNAV